MSDGVCFELLMRRATISFKFTEYDGADVVTFHDAANDSSFATVGDDGNASRFRRISGGVEFACHSAFGKCVAI